MGVNAWTMQAVKGYTILLFLLGVQDHVYLLALQQNSNTILQVIKTTFVYSRCSDVYYTFCTHSQASQQPGKPIIPIINTA